MIRFACTCGTVMEVPDDRAGASLQCPLCRKLVDVPTLNELASLTEDGTFRVDAAELADEPNRLADLQRAFAPQRVDADGNEIDLRRGAGGSDPVADEDVLEMLEDARPSVPKYDPVTGELIRALALKNEPVKFDPQTIPMAKAVINYASGETARQAAGWRIIPELMHLQNVVVMLVIFCGHLFLQLMMIPMALVWLLTPSFIVLVAFMMAHYSNVVNEIGTEQTDELPRPGRNLSWHEDLWYPFVHFVVAFFICYGALLFIGEVPPAGRLAFAGTVLLLGTIAFPALFLTTTTSGTFLNLSPDRVLGVISTLGMRYLLCVILWGATMVVYFLGLARMMLAVIALLSSSSGSARFTAPSIIVTYPLLLLGILLMHAFCWYLGLQYRQHHESFNWLLQRHHRKIETVRAAKGFVAVKTQPGQTMAVASSAPAKPQAAHSTEQRGG